MDDLIRSLEKSIGLYDVVLEPVEGGASVTGKIGEELEVITPGEYEVRLLLDSNRVTPHRIKIEGGEQLEVYHDPRGRRLIHRRYREASDRQLECTDGEFFVSALFPQITSGNVGQTFEFTIQDGGEGSRFSPRPTGIWVTIRPIVGGRPLTGESVLHFYDLKFRPNTPVPVAQVTVPNWPANSREAEISLWFRSGADIPPKEQREPVRDDDDIRYDSMPGIVFSMQRDFDTDGDPILVVEEKYESDPEDRQRARIVAYPPPNELLQRTLFEGGVRHEFHYRGGLRPKYVQIVSREQIQSEYVQLTEPVRIGLAEF